MKYNWIAWVVIGCAGCTSMTAPEKSFNDLPNFIVMLVDDQAWNGTSVRMLPGMAESASDFHQTPHLDSLASMGMRFSNARASAPVCAPSRYSIQFGKSPARMRLIRVGMDAGHIPHGQWVSIAKLLRNVDSTYVAGHFGKWGMGASPETFGFDESDGPTKNYDGGFVNDKSQWETTTKEDPKKILHVTERASQFLDSCAKTRQPFYLQMSHYAVHSSIETTTSSLETMAIASPGERHKHVGFAAMTQDLDESLGQIMKKLDELELMDNTYLIYMSDNGGVPNIPGAKKYTQSLNHPLQRGKWDAMEGGLRVPMVVAGPGVEPGSHTICPIWGADLLPTIASLAGGTHHLPDSLDGGSFSNLLLQGGTGKVTRPYDGMAFHVPYQNKIALNRPHSAWISGDFKLLYFHDDGETRLYDLQADIGEQHDLAESLPAVAERMSSELLGYLHEVSAPRWQEGITWKNAPFRSFESIH
tara:strand:+ start:1228 stop:2646 length:1419 start_codon:yes stop_codon:yes gene_type:complete